MESVKTVIACPLYAEAEGLIQSMNMSKMDQFKGISCFLNGDKRTAVVITGSGRLHAAMSAGALFAQFSMQHFVVFGSCAGLRGQKPGSIYMVNKVSDIETGKSYYPDMIPSSFPEAALISGEEIYGNEGKAGDLPVPFDINAYLDDPALAEYGLYDMETSALCYAASRFLGPHQIHILRTVTDHHGIIQIEEFRRLMKEAGREIIPFLSSLTGRERASHNEAFDDELASVFHCSLTMQRQLHQLLLYCNTAGIDMRKEIEQLKEEGFLPAESREDGKKALNELIKRTAG